MPLRGVNEYRPAHHRDLRDSPVCGDRLALYKGALSLFEDPGAQLFGLSVDSLWSHRAYADSRQPRYPLLADSEPKGEIARNCGMYSAEKGTARRALFVIDTRGVIRRSQLGADHLNAGAGGILNVLENLSRGKG